MYNNAVRSTRRTSTDVLRCDADAMRTNRNRLEQVETDKYQKDPIRTGTIGHDDMKITHRLLCGHTIYIYIYIYIHTFTY